MPASVAKTPAQEALVGNRSSKKYHRASCKWAQSIKEKNRVALESPEDARRQGFEPCKECLAH
jgi:methylphosphotriester-DNA--protein-cysteine methyltransferase